jgi:hypothetical protein
MWNYINRICNKRVARGLLLTFVRLACRCVSERMLQAAFLAVGIGQHTAKRAKSHPRAIANVCAGLFSHRLAACQKVIFWGMAVNCIPLGCNVVSFLLLSFNCVGVPLVQRFPFFFSSTKI